MLKLDGMPLKTRAVFELLAKEAALQEFVLIGGTALSIQINHRLSEDLDFCLFGHDILSQSLDSMIRALSHNHQVILMTPPSEITKAKINGIDLLAHSRDYLIDGVKVAFFARNDNAYQYFSGLDRLKSEGVVFGVMAAASIFVMKAWLLQKRVKSRDLFDLMALVASKIMPFSAIFDEAREADVAIFSEETIKNALIGAIPIENGDEGFESINLQASLKDIYSFFSDQINQYEIEMARRW